MTSAAARGFGHGKVILLGEHSVVHGHPALAGAIDSGYSAEARRGEPIVTVPAWETSATPGDGSDLGAAFEALLSRAPAGAREAEVTVFPEVPSRAGLGSSAAMSVAIARAVAALADRRLEPEEAEEWAGAAEAVFHGGRASGVDAAVAARGGLLRFVRGAEPKRVSLASPIEAVVAHVEPRASTAQMVAIVASALERNPGRVTTSFERIASLVDAALAAAESSEAERLGALLDQNHEVLAGLGLSTPALDRACRRAREAGALGAKLTGAGGGGCMVAFAPGRQDEVVAALQKESLWVAAVSIGG